MFKEVDLMGFYMCQFAYTPEAWTSMTKNPQDRSKPVNELAQKLGSRVVGLYYYFGDYDGILLFEAPDDITANAVIVASMAPGHLKVTRTSRMFTSEETVEIMRKAGSVNFEAGPSSQWFSIYS
ncbi:MAG: GYD domain-containing protein [Chloroflexi bacterium]|nr:MAG: GYD domain-containing protein [Chloroflexota bacterium]